MAGPAIIPTKALSIEIDIFSNKSSLILFWLLIHHKEAKANGFSVNELSRQTKLSVGLVHKVIKQLEYNGLIIAKGLRTSKIFFIKYPERLLTLWVQEYNLIKKTKTLGFANIENLSHNEKHKLGLIPALHTAAGELYKLKATNLKSKEFYLFNWTKLDTTVEKLNLHEMDRGYELLLIKPYYPALLEKLLKNDADKTWQQAYALLTVLDLCHFPLRGIEQAEVLYRKLSYLSSIAPWSEVENAIG